MSGGHGGDHTPVATTFVVVSVVGAVAGVVAGVVGLFVLFGETRLAQVAELALLVAALAAASGAAVAWMLRVRPGTFAACVLAAPFAVAWALFLPWYRLRFPLAYIGWSAISLLALAALTVWLRRSDMRRPRRTLVYMLGIFAIVAVNGAGIAAVAWRNTNAFGLRGHPAPWTAFETLMSASCLSDNRFHQRGDRLVEARCPSGPEADYYAGAYDVSEFDDTLCGAQPRQAFAKWWEWNRTYQIQFTLEFRPQRTRVDGKDIRAPYPAGIGGGSATIVYTMRLASVFREHPQAPGQPAFRPTTETWTVRLETVALGGWKVCQIDVSSAVSAIVD